MATMDERVEKLAQELETWRDALKETVDKVMARDPNDDYSAHRLYIKRLDNSAALIRAQARVIEAEDNWRAGGGDADAKFRELGASKAALATILEEIKRNG